MPPPDDARKREDACSTDYASSTQRAVKVRQTTFRSREVVTQYLAQALDGQGTQPLVRVGGYETTRPDRIAPVDRCDLVSLSG